MCRMQLDAVKPEPRSTRGRCGKGLADPVQPRDIERKRRQFPVLDRNGRRRMGQPATLAGRYLLAAPEDPA